MIPNRRLPFARARLAGACLTVALQGAAAAAATGDEPPRDSPPPTREELVKLLDAALPAAIEADNTDLVTKLLEPVGERVPAPAFDRTRAVAALLGTGASISPDCTKTVTPVGDPDQGKCTVSLGLERGTKPYSLLEHSKQPGLGTARFMSRPAVATLDPAKLVPVRMSDEEAYKRAIDLLTNTFGLPTEQIAPTAADAVKSLNMAWGNNKARLKTLNFQKLVYVRRGLPVKGIVGMAWVPAPGTAKVFMEDGEGLAGVRKATVEGWMELRRHPLADPKNAKGRAELIDEIADDLMTNIGPVARLGARIVLDAEPTPTHGLLLPAVRLAVSPVAANPTEAEQANRASTAGEIHSYALVRLPESPRD
jgi:hypothetical protein